MQFDVEEFGRLFVDDYVGWNSLPPRLLKNFSRNLWRMYSADLFSQELSRAIDAVCAQGLGAGAREARIEQLQEIWSSYETSALGRAFAQQLAPNEARLHSRLQILYRHTKEIHRLFVEPVVDAATYVLVSSFFNVLFAECMRFCETTAVPYELQVRSADHAIFNYQLKLDAMAQRLALENYNADGTPMR
jgi:hypothetical protein